MLGLALLIVCTRKLSLIGPAPCEIRFRQSDIEKEEPCIKKYFREPALLVSQHMGNRADTGKCKGFGCTWDSLRNSAGEKILQLRSHPLGMPSDSNFCSVLSDLSEEQRFDVSYLDLGGFMHTITEME